MPLLPQHRAPSEHEEGQPYLRQRENCTEGVSQKLAWEEELRLQCAREPTRGLKACPSVCLTIMTTIYATVTTTTAAAAYGAITIHARSSQNPVTVGLFSASRKSQRYIF